MTRGCKWVIEEKWKSAYIYGVLHSPSGAWRGPTDKNLQCEDTDGKLLLFVNLVGDVGLAVAAWVHALKSGILVKASQS